ncbi:VWA domain-containing protein [[Mycobacterium] wendilense]|uniref:VWA domain-containing protein n=1 Tax=[Mycobacterium] wendilense TaxID=3064284 RepID=A0ABM9M9Y7_9MYCO|nr:VWA domain-containing protein [Mycolicibacterium sp. MU0050]CAJ1580068.1 VWA domain-containing protein [Mycolicibacterium sp. MU0050]
MAPLAEPADVLLSRLIELAALARARGVAVSPAKTVDLIAAIGVVDVLERSALQRVVRLTLSGSAADGPVLDALVDRLFPAMVATGAPQATPEQLRDRLVDAVVSGDRAAAAELGGQASGLVAADHGDQPASLTRATQQALRAMELSQVLRRAMKQADGFDSDSAELWRQALGAFEDGVSNGLRAQGCNDAVDDGVLDADLMHLSAAEQVALRDCVHALARRLATRLSAQRTNAVSGRLDVRRTQRRALATGGIPLDPILRRRRRHRPQLVVLCDVSGSMADYTRFSLALLGELASQMAHIRAYAFVDGSADVTHLMTASNSLVSPQTLLLQPGVVTGDGHTNYGTALQSFLDSPSLHVDMKATLVIFGDARTRGQGTGLEALRELGRRANKIYWLNPEPREQWGVGDSSAAGYGAVCTDMVEVRTLNQLADWIATTL